MASSAPQNIINFISPEESQAWRRACLLSNQVSALKHSPLFLPPPWGLRDAFLLLISDLLPHPQQTLLQSLPKSRSSNPNHLSPSQDAVLGPSLGEWVLSLELIQQMGPAAWGGIRQSCPMLLLLLPICWGQVTDLRMYPLPKATGDGHFPRLDPGPGSFYFFVALKSLPCVYSCQDCPCALSPLTDPGHQDNRLSSSQLSGQGNSLLEERSSLLREFHTAVSVALVGNSNELRIDRQYSTVLSSRVSETAQHRIL